MEALPFPQRPRFPPLSPQQLAPPRRPPNQFISDLDSEEEVELFGDITQPPIPFGNANRYNPQNHISNFKINVDIQMFDGHLGIEEFFGLDKLH